MELVHFSDCGPYRGANQDAYCVRIAQTPTGLIAMAVVCDGMGGLKHGEVASAAVVTAFEDWFDRVLPAQLGAAGGAPAGAPAAPGGALDADAVSIAWNALLQDRHEKIKRFGRQHGLRLGTTVSALLLTPAQYCLFHAGDSRIYLDDGQAARQLTVDQTLAMRELMAGRLTPQQYETDRRRNILLQCVGDRSVAPTFQTGPTPAQGACLLCSDGYSHHLSAQLLHGVFAAGRGRAALQQGMLGLGQTARTLGEQDNMTCVALRWDSFAAVPAATLSLLPETGPQNALEVLAKVSYTNTEYVL